MSRTSRRLIFSCLATEKTLIEFSFFCHKYHPKGKLYKIDGKKVMLIALFDAYMLIPKFTFLSTRHGRRPLTPRSRVILHPRPGAEILNRKGGAKKRVV